MSGCGAGPSFDQDLHDDGPQPPKLTGEQLAELKAEINQSYLPNAEVDEITPE